MSLPTMSDTVPRTYALPRSSCQVTFVMFAYRLSSYLPRHRRGSGGLSTAAVRAQYACAAGGHRVRGSASVTRSSTSSLRRWQPALSASRHWRCFCRLVLSRQHTKVSLVRGTRPGSAGVAVQGRAHLSCMSSSANSSSAARVAAARSSARCACALAGSGGVAAASAAATSRLRPASQNPTLLYLGSCHGAPPQPLACAEGERGWPGAAPPPPRRPGRRGQAAWLRPGREPARAAARRPRRRAPGQARAGRRRVRPPWSAAPPPRRPRAGAAGRAPAGAQRAFGHAASHAAGGERHAGPARHPQLQQCCSGGFQRSSRAAR